MIKDIQRVLIVGSWAKEQITIENIKKDKDIEIYSYMDTKNPGIISLVKDYKVGSLYDIRNIADYAFNSKIELTIVTTAGPLSVGLIDLLEKEGIPAFGPNKDAARLEFDKAFARRLMKKYQMEYVMPEFQIFDNIKEAINFASSLNWNVAIKPVGLTDGLGVKVFGDQLKTKNEAIDYIKEILNKRIGISSDLIVEEKLEGEEFSIQCLVHNGIMLPTPAVQDFKKLLVGEKGPNTASMGSYSDKGYLLPFMQQEDYDDAIHIIKKTLNFFKLETGKDCSGFLYGQFMLTEKGIKLIEYNFRPGDPEWLNTISTMKNNILDIIINLINGNKVEIEFEDIATVCKYIVPKKYPILLNQTLRISIDEDKIKDANIYYSCGIDEEGNLNTGTERGIAFLAKGNNIQMANENVQKAISNVKGDFYYRHDIGTEELIKSKIDHINKLKNKLKN